MKVVVTNDSGSKYMGLVQREWGEKYFRERMR